MVDQPVSHEQGTPVYIGRRCLVSEVGPTPVGGVGMFIFVVQTKSPNMFVCVYTLVTVPG